MVIIENVFKISTFETKYIGARQNAFYDVVSVFM